MRPLHLRGFMARREAFTGVPSRVRFIGGESETAHGRWYRMIAEHYDALWGPERPRLVSEFIHDVFQRHKPVQSVLDMACGTFSIDLELFQWGYDIVGCDVSPEMLEVARENLRQ
ncbi:MAG: methyltransferase domain-containing protein, partial [Candidatus Methylomirabilales bacterium]